MQWLARYQKWFLLGIVTLVFVAVRLPGLGRFVTIDEIFWLTKSAELSLSVEEERWEDTGFAGHPGLTTAWAGFLGIRSVIPDFAQNPPEQITDFHLRTYFRQAGFNPVQILAQARQVMVLFNTAVFALLFVYLYRLWGAWPAVIAAAVLALDPFYIAHQRLLHQDGLMAGLVLLSLAAFAAHQRSGSRLDAAVSGLAAGLAWLTKSPTLLLGPCIFGLAIWHAVRQPAARRQALVGFVVWGLAAALVYMALWPKMWVAPVQALTEMWSYAAETAGGEHSGPIFFNRTQYPTGELGAASSYFYLFTWLWRSTPVDLLGLLAAALLVWNWRKADAPRSGLLGLAGFALLFVLAMSVASKKFDRYMLPAYAALVLLAGWGLSVALQRWNARNAVRWAAAAGLLGLQATLALSTYPYYLSYYNPALGGARAAQDVMMIGWGEGLDEAASYLSAQPGIANASVAAWYSNAFNFQYPYEVDDIPIATELDTAQLQDLLAHDYLVIYVHQWQRGTPQNLLDALAGLEPVYAVVVDGIEYVQIYQP